MNGYTFGHDIHNLRYTEQQPLSFDPSGLADPMGLIGKAAKIELYANIFRSGRGMLGTMGFGVFGSSPMHPYSGRSKYAYQAKSLWRPQPASMNPFGLFPTAIDALNIPRNLEGIHSMYKSTKGLFQTKPVSANVINSVYLGEDAFPDSPLAWNTYNTSKKGSAQKSWYHRFFSSDEAKSKAMSRTNYMGFLDRRLIMEDEYRQMMRNILPKDIYQKISKKDMSQGFVNKLRGLYDQSPTPYISSDDFSSIWNARHRSVFSIATGSEEVGPWAYRVKDAASKTALFTDEAAKKTVLQTGFTTSRAKEGGILGKVFGRGRKFRDTSVAMKAAIENYTEFASGTPLTNAAYDSMADYSTMYAKRLANARILKATMIGTIGVDILAHSGRKTYELMRDIPSQIASTISRSMRTEFGTGDVLWTSRMATERQRAVHAIQDAQMNARYLLGQEASLYH